MDAFVEYYLRGDGKVVFMLIEAIGKQTDSTSSVPSNSPLA